MSEQTPSRGGAGTADGPDPQDRPDGDDREDRVLSSPEARREAEMGAAEVGDPPEPDHAHSQHARRGGGHVSRLQPSSWTSSATRYRPRAGARDSPSGLGSGRKCLVVFNYSISITN